MAYDDPNLDRWLLMADQLEKAGANVTRMPASYGNVEHIIIPLTPRLTLWILFHKQISYVIYKDNSLIKETFSNCFDTILQEYKDVFVFYLDLMMNCKW